MRYALSLLFMWAWMRLTGVDYKIYEQVVEMTHRFKSIYYDSNE